MRELLLLSLLISACDTPVGECADPPAGISLAEPAGAEHTLTFRGGPPQGLIATTIGGGAIYRGEFMKLVMACAEQADPQLTLTLSWYQPDLTSDQRVVGLGYSMMAPEALWSCYEQLFIEQGATPF